MCTNRDESSSLKQIAIGYFERSSKVRFNILSKRAEKDLQGRRIFYKCSNETRQNSEDIGNEVFFLAFGNFNNHLHCSF